MSILSPEQLEHRKADARREEIRQNVKSHCTKIRDGIRNNGSTSGKRAIWELFQNARDLSESAVVKITLTEDEFVFAHQGEAFTYDSLCSLVKQVSSREKEDDISIGQYGTGFLTTHKFGRKITIKGSMMISDIPKVYVDIPNFVIDRDNFNDIPAFIEDMTEQIGNVEKLMDAEQMNIPREWTELHYELNDERYSVAANAIEEAIRLMPYVLTFNDRIGCCTILYKGSKISFAKEDRGTNIEGLKCKRIIKSVDERRENIDCYFLELNGGESRILLPLKSETEVCSFGNVPRLFVHFPLIGANHFNVGFLFHSHRFTPEEKRDNIIVPKDNDATEQIATENKAVLDEMTQYLWSFLEAHIDSWHGAIKMAAINIKDSGYAELKTEDYYKGIKKAWVEEFQKLKLIEIDDNKYSMDDKGHPLVLEPSLELFLTAHQEKDYLDVIYPYARDASLIPCKEELLKWSQIIGEWNKDRTENFLSLETIVKYVSRKKGDRLFDMLTMLVDAEATAFFEKYELLPNREGNLKKRDDLRDARAIPDKLYELVKALDAGICEKMVNAKYQDLIKLTPYNRQNLREELNGIVKAKENECWRDADTPQPYDGTFERSLIRLCSAFTTQNGDSKRNKLMPIICRFEGIEDYEEIYIPAAEDDQTGFDMYRQVFVSLVENQMMKIEKQDETWVKTNISELVDFVDYARGDDYKTFCTQYAIYPDLNGQLHEPEGLKKNQNVNAKLFELYESVIGEDLRTKCVDSRFEGFYPKYAEEDYQYTSESVAKEIQNKLSADQYQDTILLDIIDLTEQDNSEGLRWRILFKDIYEQRESIRYHLGSDDERKAINRMLKRKNPRLMTRMADVSERNDSDVVLSKIEEAITQYEHERHIKMLGDYIEKNVQRFVEEALSDEGIEVTNEQGGQDLILSKVGFENYYIEIKSRWVDREQAIMSAMQFARAVENPTRYALISAQMWNFEQQRAIDGELLTLEEMKPLMRVCDNIGKLVTDLKQRVDEAFKGGEEDIRISGSYDVRVPQKVFGKGFDELIKEVRRMFEE